MNLATLRAQSRTLLDEPTDEDESLDLDSEIDGWINVANRRIATLLGNLEDTDTQNIVAAQAAYALPSDILKIVRVTWNSYPLKAITFQELNSYERIGTPTTSDVGNPLYWYTWAGDIYLYPAPASALTSGLVLYYKKLPALLVEDTDIPEHAEELHDLIPPYVAYLGFSRDTMRGNAQDFLQEFNQGIEEARMSAMVPDESEAPTIRDVYQ